MGLRQRAMDLHVENGLVLENGNALIAGVGNDLAAEIESIGNEAERENGIERGRGIETVTMLTVILENGLAAGKGKGNVITVNVVVKTVQHGRLFVPGPSHLSHLIQLQS